MKNILIINGHPAKDSFSTALAEAYKQGATAGEFKVVNINIRDLDFDPNLKDGYNKRMTLEPDLEEAIKQIKLADHVVWVFPMWWYSTPALLKGFIDRTFLPNIAFKPRKGKLPEKLLKGKSARVIITSDTPRWFDYLFMKYPAINQFRKGTLAFTGFKPVKVTYISPIKESSDAFREKWLNKVKALGNKGK